ncbi:hypothetical protein HMPREF9630_01266 [Peptoanaerobacter stomatis]|uniref:ROK family protein n=1 Tax=Peptoanaerobacter stomatis TaxID=796937 RepID=V9HUW6_9FIRM|nr:ROK family protein [Peptoanaerobacter stomatis]EHL18010.1 hypothetical protein HMPREF9630_01266 [Peptoanaerobacter stomatis]
MKKYIAIDIGGTSIKYGLIANEQILFSCDTDTMAKKGGWHIVSLVKNIVRKYLEEQEDIAGVCISTAGMVDTKKGEIIYAGKQIPQYIGVNWKKEIKDEFNLPCEVENDVNCAGLSEAISGAGKGKQSVLCLTIGTGIGACMVENGKIYNGHSYSAFEVGYLKLKDGDFQDLASTTALIESYKEEKNDCEKDINGKLIFDLAKNGDETAIKQIDKLIDYMCIGISNICYIINPSIVVLGGGIMEQKEYMLPKIKECMKKYLLKNIYDNTKFDCAKHKNKAGMLGAYYHFLNEQKSK